MGIASYFSVGVTPDFLTDVREHILPALQAKLESQQSVHWEFMSPQPGGVAAPEVLDRYDAVLALGLRVTGESLVGVERLLLIARWGVGYDPWTCPP
ncbi:MAG: hypothetical protein ACP5U2_05040 [Bryobacteraceae bacterium]